MVASDPALTTSLAAWSSARRGNRRTASGRASPIHRPRSRAWPSASPSREARSLPVARRRYMSMTTAMQAARAATARGRCSARYVPHPTPQLARRPFTREAARPAVLVSREGPGGILQGQIPRSRYGWRARIRTEDLLIQNPWRARSWAATCAHAAIAGYRSVPPKFAP
jgi:hypothetical protein